MNERLQFLDVDFVAVTMQEVVEIYGGDPTTWRSSFFDIVKGLQKLPFHRSPIKDRVHQIEWNNEKLTEFLEKYKVLSKKEIDGKRHVIASRTQRTKLVREYEKALDRLVEVDDHFFRLVSTTVQTIGIFDLEEQDGGSVSSAIGFFYLSPKPSWTTDYFAEVMVHETIHNSLFLFDMVYNLFPDLQALLLPEAHVTSAIRCEKRPFDKSFHAACVAAGLIAFNQKAGNRNRANALTEALKPSLDELNEIYEACRRRGVVLTKDLGELIIKQLRRFMDQ